MSVLVVGSIALDTIKTPKAEKAQLLGGSASHAAVAASFFSPVKLVGVVGNDFPRRYLKLYSQCGIDLAGLQIADGKTFNWTGQYEVNMNNRRTVSVDLGVFASFSPNLPVACQKAPFVLLGNIAPSLQIHVLDQMTRPKFVVADTMDLWLANAPDDLLRLLRRVDAFVLNESEARQLTNQDNLVAAAARIHKLGPRFVIIKKGEHGAILSGPSGLFLAPAFPLKNVVDPTGAGDSFLGGLVGYLASRKGAIESNLRRAVICGSVVASFWCENFGLSHTTKISRRQIEQRVSELERMAKF